MNEIYALAPRRPRPRGLSARKPITRGPLALLLALIASSALAQAISPDGSTLLDTASGSLLTNAGTWTFGAAAPGGDVILLNGVSTQGTATEMAVATSGTLYSYSAGIWYAWNGNSFCCASTTAPAGISSTPASPTASVTVSWTAPTTNTDGTALSDLSGYLILYGTSPSALNESVTLSNAGATSQVVRGLTPGATYYFELEASASDGTFSVPSAPVSYTIPALIETPSPPSHVTLTVAP